jgi:hypothetical protein
MASHGLDSNVSVLRRWGAVAQQFLGGDAPLPVDYTAWAADNITAAMQMEQADPELVSLLSNTAPSSLKVQALTGEWSAEAPSAEQRADAAVQAQIDALTNNGQFNPWGKAGFYTESGEFVPPQQGNLTAALQLESLSPELAAQLKAEAQPAMPTMPPGALSAEAAARINSALAAGVYSN